MENAFGQLKGRWRRLLKRNDMLVENVSTVVAAACVLHNVCEIHNEPFNDSWLSADSDEQPTQSTAISQQSARPKQIQATLEKFFKQILCSNNLHCQVQYLL